MRKAETEEYLSTLVALINCIVTSPDSVKERMKLRNEFIGVCVCVCVRARVHARTYICA